jgi:thimet oligopeptidase
LKFVRVLEDQSHYKFWHSEVELYQVKDVNTQQLMGHFFLDLHPREGKYGHACMCTLQRGCAIFNDNGEEVARQLPVNAMLCNFPKPTAEKPALLSHSDVETFFHEFGHVMHQICGQPQLAHFAGTSVERDFVEAPSQMLENWCWKAASLNRMSGHYTDSTKKIPEALLQGLIKSKNANCGLLVKRQLYFGILDQTMHTSAKCDTAQLCQTLQPKIWGIPAMPGTNFVASFGHLAGGYEAQYYGYMWSEVYSADMFHTMFGEKNLLDPKAGMNYRQKILSWGGSRDAIDSLCDFLGRKPNNTAFLKDKGLKVDEEENSNSNTSSKI